MLEVQILLEFFSFTARIKKCETINFFYLIKKYPKLSDKMASMIEAWYADNEFKNDPALK